MIKTVENLSNKVIGIGDITILPGEQATVPSSFIGNPIISMYEEAGLIKFIGVTGEHKEAETGDTVNETDEEEKKNAEITAEAAEALKKARLASLEGITEEDLATLAKELGISPADCKDNADMLKKVKAALKK